MSSSLIAQPLHQPAERNLSWGEVDWMIEVAVADMRLRKFRPSQIVPIAGGGLIPAALMAYRFYKKDNVPVQVLPPIYAKSYDRNNQQHDLDLIIPDSLYAYNATTTLIVDDILDTGATYNAVRRKLPLCLFFSLVTKIVGHPNWYSTLDREGTWWNFPWEKVPTEPKG